MPLAARWSGQAGARAPGRPGGCPAGRCTGRSPAVAEPLGGDGCAPDGVNSLALGACGLVRCEQAQPRAVWEALGESGGGECAQGVDEGAPLAGGQGVSGEWVTWAACASASRSSGASRLRARSTMYVMRGLPWGTLRARG